MNARSKPVLQLSSVSVIRGGHEVLSSIDWCIEPGQHWALLGANGSGKTTLLDTLLAYAPAARGRIELLGNEYGQRDWRKLRKRVGVVSVSIERGIESDTGLGVIYSGRDAMLGSWGTRDADAERRARQLLERVECEALESRSFRVMSPGERQRLLIGRALMAEPELLILDEPCAGLDPGARERFLAFLHTLTGQPDAPSTILVTHHVEEITPTFTHVLLLKAGHLLAAGPCEQVMTSERLSEVFDLPLQLRRRDGRYSLQLGDDAPTW